jgi:hypothetical protein
LFGRFARRVSVESRNERHNYNTDQSNCYNTDQSNCAATDEPGQCSILSFLLSPFPLSTGPIIRPFRASLLATTRAFHEYACQMVIQLEALAATTSNQHLSDLHNPNIAICTCLVIDAKTTLAN